MDEGSPSFENAAPELDLGASDRALEVPYPSADAEVDPSSVRFGADPLPE